MKPGTRIRMNDRCVWPKRRGATGVVVAPPADGTYPGPVPASEILVLLDDDPLGSRDRYPADRGWTCVTSKDSVDAIGLAANRQAIIEALAARHVRLDANAREKIADIVLDALGQNP